MANNLSLLMGSYNRVRTDSAPPVRTAPVAHLGLTYGDANRGPWYPSERERERVRRKAERDREKRERRQELRDAPVGWGAVRGFLEPETGAEMGALLGTSMLPVAGEAIDLADIAAGIQDRDLSRIGWATGGLMLPFVAGSTLRKIVQRGVAQGAADMTRKELQSLLSAKGLPATGTTETLRELATVVGKNPEDWTRSEFDLARPHIRVHQDFRSGNDPAKIMKEGLTRGQVDPLSGVGPGADSWSWGGNFQGTPGGAYLMWPGDINYSSGTSPWMRSGKPFMHISPAKGDDPFTAITGSRRAADEVAEAGSTLRKFARGADRVPDTTVSPRERRGIEGIPEAGEEGRGIKSVRDLPQAEAVEQADRGAHLVRKADGSYVGAPNWVKSPQALGRLRRQLDELAEEGVQGKDWYERAEAGNLELAGPYRDRTALLSAEEGLWSPQAIPDVNLGTALLGHNAYELGAPLDKVRTTRQAQAYNTARDAGALPDLGPKTGIYGEHLDPFVETPITGVNDVWHGRAFGYDTDKISPQAHAFMDAETLLAAERLNARQAGTFTDWDGRGTQAAIWVRMKGADLAEKRFGGDLQRGMEEAQKTYPDYFSKYAYNATHEAVPGRGTGHLPGLLDEPWEVREAYTDAVPWTTQSGHDVMYDDWWQQRSRDATGYYMGETNPVRVSLPMAPRGAGVTTIDPMSLQSIRATESLRSLLDAQNATGGHRVVTDMPAGRQTSAFSSLDAAVDPDLFDEAAAEVTTHFPIDIGRGVTWMPMDDAATSSRDVLRSIAEGGELDKAKEVLGSPGTARVGIDSHYVPLLERVGSEQGTGVATQAMLDEIDKAVEMGAVNLPERLSAEPIRRRALGLLERDATWGPQFGGDRLDMENLRTLFGKGGLAEVRAGLLRGDYLPAVGLLGGYSALQGGRRLESERR